MGDHQQFASNRQQQQPTMSSGLARYQSAPSSYFASLLNNINNNNIGGLEEICDEFVNPRPSTPQTDPIFATFIPTSISEGPIKSENENYVHEQLQCQGSGYSSASQMIHQNESQPSMLHCSLPMANSPLDSSYLPQMNIGGGRSTNLLRQSSSPANFFSNFDIEGYGVRKSMGNFGCDCGSNLEVPVPSPSKLGRQVDFASALPSSSEIMNSISEIENKNTEMTGFPFSSWDDSDLFSDSFLKRLEDDDTKTFSGMNALENQNDEVGGSHHRPTTLSHHLSLPKNSSELSAMDKFLQVQDSVRCKLRAKRGCATHPRSIAERVRRTRISERMRKLQELVPNMDKQTNTSDMLDLAVDYIKDLQDQVQSLSDHQANCTCSNHQTL